MPSKTPPSRSVGEGSAKNPSVQQPSGSPMPPAQPPRKRPVNPSTARPPSRAPFILGILVGGAIVLLLTVAFIGLTQHRANNTATRPSSNTDATLLVLGAQVYSANCQSCHGVNLEGAVDWNTEQGRMHASASPLNAHGPVPALSEETFRAVIHDGGQVIAPPGQISAMPGFGGSLTDYQIDAVMAYIKNTWTMTDTIDVTPTPR